MCPRCDGVSDCKDRSVDRPPLTYRAERSDSRPEGSAGGEAGSLLIRDATCECDVAMLTPLCYSLRM